MSKEQRARNRAERIARETAQREAAGRARKLRLAVGGVAVAAVVVAAAIAFAARGGDSPGSGSEGFADVSIPDQKTTDLRAAVRLAGCRVRTYEDAGGGHTAESVAYKTSPPTSGEHNPQAAEDRAYLPPDVPSVEQSVHSLEHGRIAIQWRGLPKREIDQLYAVYRERDGYHALMFENQTDMPAAVAATAWQNALTCPSFNPRVIDAVRAFRETYTDRGPEFVP